MHDRFWHTLFPPRAVICGRSLPPLTLWRLAALQALDSPFLSPDPARMVTPGDLCLALRIAATPNLQAPDLRPRWLDARLRRRLERHRAEFHMEAAAFLEWLRVHQLMPELWRSELHEPRHITAPLVMSQVAGLLSLGIPHAQAWDMTPGYAAWLTLTAAEREHEGIKFFDEEEAAASIADLPDLDAMSEEDILAQARADLGPAFEAWHAARRTARGDTQP